MVRCMIGLNATRLGCVSTGTGGGTGEGAGVVGGRFAGGGGVVGDDSAAGAMMRPVPSLPRDHGGMLRKVERNGHRIRFSWTHSFWLGNLGASSLATMHGKSSRMTTKESGLGAHYRICGPS